VITAKTSAGALRDDELCQASWATGSEYPTPTTTATIKRRMRPA
jgi:hypothetical protein